jgi:hypothetical protein
MLFLVTTVALFAFTAEYSVGFREAKQGTRCNANHKTIRQVIRQFFPLADRYVESIRSWLLPKCMHQRAWDCQFSLALS